MKSAILYNRFSAKLASKISAKFPWNRPFFPRICPWKSREIWLFFRDLPEALTWAVKFDSLSSQTYLSVVLLRMQKERSLSTKHGRCQQGSARLHRLDYTLFRLEWVLNVLTSYSDTKTTRADARIVHLVHQAREAVTDANQSPSTDVFQAGSIFTGQHGRPKLEVTQEQLQFLAESWLNTPQIASLLGVSQRMVERRLREWNLNISLAKRCQARYMGSWHGEWVLVIV